MPRRAMRLEARPRTSAPSNRIEPDARPSMPMIARKVVVLPAPLRPSRVTTSPAGTSNSMPCRICDSPYQPCKPETWRSVFDGAPEASGMAGPYIGFDDGGVLRDFGIDALGQDLAARQHGDLVREIGH